MTKSSHQRDYFDSPETLRIYLESRGFQVQNPEDRTILYMWLKNEKSGIQTDGRFFITSAHPFVVIEPLGDAITSIYTRSTHPRTSMRKAPELLQSKVSEHKCGSKKCRIDKDAWVCYKWPIPSFPPEMSNGAKNWFSGIVNTSRRFCLETSPKVSAQIQLCASARR